MYRRSLKLVCSWVLVGLLTAAPLLSLSAPALAEENNPPLSREERLEKFRREAITVWGVVDYGGAVRLQTEEPGKHWFIQKGRFTEISDLEFLKLAGEEELYNKFNQRRLAYGAAAIGCFILGLVVSAPSSSDIYYYYDSDEMTRSQLLLLGSLAASAFFWYQSKGGFSGHFLTFEQAKELADKYNRKLLRELQLDLEAEGSV